MADLSNINSEDLKLPSEFNDPFTSKSVDRVYYEFHKTKSTIFRNGCFHKATIHLENGNTKGTQDFYDDNPDILRQKVENFINGLK